MKVGDFLRAEHHSQVRLVASCSVISVRLVSLLRSLLLSIESVI